MRFQAVHLVALYTLTSISCSDSPIKAPVDSAHVASDLAPSIPDKATKDLSTTDSHRTPDRTATDHRPWFDGTLPECPQHTNLVPKVPCLCFGQYVFDVAAQYPECKPPMEIHCCPGTSSPNCEDPGNE
jgi:hypothetical protein